MYGYDFPRELHRCYLSAIGDLFILLFYYGYGTAFMREITWSKLPSNEFLHRICVDFEKLDVCDLTFVYSKSNFGGRQIWYIFRSQVI